MKTHEEYVECLEVLEDTGGLENANLSNQEQLTKRSAFDTEMESWKSAAIRREPAVRARSQKSCKSRLSRSSRSSSVSLAVVKKKEQLALAQLKTKQVLREPSSETQGRSVGPGEKARQKFSSTGGKAPGYRLSPDHFQTIKRMLVPDWAQKCFVLLCPIGEQHLLSSFREFVHDGFYLAIVARFVHQEAKELPRSRKTFRMPSAGAF